MSDATPLKSNLQLEVIDIWGVHFVCISLCQSNISTSWRPWTICPNGWSTSYVAADSKNSKKMIRGITFPCFEFPRVMFGSEGSHFTRQDLQEVSQRVESKPTGLLLHTTPRPMVRQKHLTRRSKTFCRRLWMPWGKDGIAWYPRHSGYIEQPSTHW